MMLKRLKFILLFSWSLIMAQFTLYGQATLNEDDVKSKTYFFEGIREKLKGNYGAAAQNYEKFLALNPNNDAVLYELSLAQFGLKNYIDSEINIRKAIALNKTNSWYYRHQLAILKKTNNISRLIVTYDNLIELEPSDIDLYFDKAAALYQISRLAEVMETYSLIESKFGTSSRLEDAKGILNFFEIHKDVSKDYDHLIDKEPLNLENYIDKANVLLVKKEFDLALEVLSRAENNVGKRYEIALLRAFIYKKTQKLDSSYANLLEAFTIGQMDFDLKLKFLHQELFDYDPQNDNNIIKIAEVFKNQFPNDSRAYDIYAEYLFKYGAIKKAAEQFEISLTKNDQNYLIWEKLVSIYNQYGNYKDVIRITEEALSSFPNQAILYYYNTFAKHRIGEKVIQDNLDFAIKLDTENKRLLSCIQGLKAELAWNKNKSKQAMEYFEKGMSIDPANYILVNSYAYFLALRMIDLKQSEDLIKKAILAEPNNMNHAATYAFILKKMGKLEEAKEWITKAIHNNKQENPVYSELMGDVLFLLGSKEQAVQLWEKSAQVGFPSSNLLKKVNEKKYFD